MLTDCLGPFFSTGVLGSVCYLRAVVSEPRPGREQSLRDAITHQHPQLAHVEHALRRHQHHSGTGTSRLIRRSNAKLRRH